MHKKKNDKKRPKRHKTIMSPSIYQINYPRDNPKLIGGRPREEISRPKKLHTCSTKSHKPKPNPRTLRHLRVIKHVESNRRTRKPKTPKPNKTTWLDDWLRDAAQTGFIDRIAPDMIIDFRDAAAPGNLTRKFYIDATLKFTSKIRVKALDLNTCAHVRSPKWRFQNKSAVLVYRAPRGSREKCWLARSPPPPRARPLSLQ